MSESNISKRILVIGDADSVFTFEYVMTMIEEKHEVVLINFPAIAEIKEEKKNYYEEHSVVVYSAQLEATAYRCLLYIAHIKTLGIFDVCHIMYFSGEAALIIKACETQFKTIVVNYWGSDFYRTLPKDEKEQMMLLKDADVVISPSIDMQDELKEKYPFLEDKVYWVSFSGSVLSKLRQGVGDESELPFIRNKEKLLIACGYNGTDAMQHELMIKAIQQCPQEIQEKIQVVFQMTYGGSAKYIKNIESLLKNVSFEYVILKDYLSDAETVSLRKAVDVFLYMETTNSSSATLTEYCYCGTVVLLADWLTFPLLENNDVYMEKVSDIKDITRKIIDVANNYEYYVDKSNKNIDKVKKIWNNLSNLKKWSDYYIDNEKVHEDNEIKAVDYLLKENEIRLRRQYMYGQINHYWVRENVKRHLPILEYVKERGWNRILLYGAGTLGERCYEELKQDSTLIVELCDQYADVEHVPWWKNSILRPDEICENEYNGMIVTPVHVYEKIVKNYNEIECISLFDVLVEGVM